MAISLNPANLLVRKGIPVHRPNRGDFLVLLNTRDLSHIPKQVAITVRIAMVEGSTASRGVPGDTELAIPSAQNPIPNAQICSIFMRLTSPDSAIPPRRQRTSNPDTTAILSFTTMPSIGMIAGVALEGGTRKPVAASEAYSDIMNAPQ